MKITKATIKNYKSLGTEQNCLLLNEGITTLIGKNESGKTNILNALLECQYNKKPNFTGKYNKNSSLAQVEIVLDLSFKNNENFNLDGLSSPFTTVVFTHDKPCKITGALSELINNDIEINEYKEILLKALDKLNVRVDASIRENIIKKFLTSQIGTAYISEYSNFFDYYGYWISAKYFISPEGNDLMSVFDALKNKLEAYYALLPTIYFFKPTEFKTRYSLEDIRKDNDILSLFKISNITKDELITAITPDSDPTLKAKAKRKIQTNVAEISKDFSTFYQKEKIDILVSPENGYFDLLVDNVDLPIVISERSNGLRWYLDLFIHLKLQNLLDKEVVLLIDEPGVYLHIDAQKKLLELFEDLSDKNQIAYTTHSPFMIETNELGRIRIVESVNGFTRISNKCHAANLTEASKMEILSPIIKALGFSMKYNFGPNFDRLNLIVEGISDYYYLQGALIACGIEPEKIPYIIPSIGVNNIHNIASILIGWGVNFKIITDFDGQAYTEIVQLNRINLKENQDYFNLPLKPVEKRTMQDNPFLIEDMFTKADFQLFDQGEKHLSSKHFFELAKKGELKLSQETLDNFNKLFSAIL